MNKFLKANVLIEQAMEELGVKIDLRNSTVQINPQTVEQCTKIKALGLDSHEVWNRESYVQLQNSLEDAGFKVDQSFNSTLGYNYTAWKLPSCSIRIQVKIELSTEDECAKLKARLAELGCHY